MAVKRFSEVTSQTTKTALRASKVGLTPGEALWTAAEDLELDRDPGQQRQHDASGDYAVGGLHGRPPHQSDAIHEGAQIADVERGFVTVDALGHSDDDDLKAWLERGLKFARSLPPK